MATTDRMSLGTADERAWEVFFDALDPDSASAATIPSGAAIVAADADNLDELKRRYRAERRPIALVDASGRVTVVKHRFIKVADPAAIRETLAAAYRRLRSAARVGV